MAAKSKVKVSSFEMTLLIVKKKRAARQAAIGLFT